MLNKATHHFLVVETLAFRKKNTREERKEKTPFLIRKKWGDQSL